MDQGDRYRVVYERPDGSRYSRIIIGKNPDRKRRVVLKGGPLHGETRPVYHDQGWYHEDDGDRVLVYVETAPGAIDFCYEGSQSKKSGAAPL